VTLLVLNTEPTAATVKPVSKSEYGSGSRDLLSGGWDEYLLTPADTSAGKTTEMYFFTSVSF
jgi:hypothetical protein